MIKKTITKSVADINPAEPVTHVPSPCVPLKSPSDSDDRLFALYLSRVSTIDLYHLPITERGLPSAYARAFDEAVTALAVFNERIQK